MAPTKPETGREWTVPAKAGLEAWNADWRILDGSMVSRLRRFLRFGGISTKAEE